MQKELCPVASRGCILQNYCTMSQPRYSHWSNQNKEQFHHQKITHGTFYRHTYFPPVVNVSDQFSSVTQLCPTLWDSMDCSTPGFPVHHQLPELAQTHDHQVSDAIKPSHLLSSPSPPAFSISQDQSQFQWVSSLHQLAKVVEFWLQHQSFQWIFRTDFLSDWLVGFPCSPRDSQESSPAL